MSGSRRRPRPRRASRLHEVPRIEPGEGWTLNVDPATKSGWAIFSGSLYKASGVAKGAAQRKRVIDHFLAMSEGKRRVGVVENWGPGWKSHIALAVTAQNRGRWLERLEEAEVPVVDVMPQTWRSRLYGRGYSNKAKTSSEQYKKLAMAHVKARLKLDTGHDEAEAILIGIWAAFAQPVAFALYPELEAAKVNQKMKGAIKRMK